MKDRTLQNFLKENCRRPCSKFPKYTTSLVAAPNDSETARGARYYCRLGRDATMSATNKGNRLIVVGETEIRLNTIESYGLTCKQITKGDLASGEDVKNGAII
ncbi:MAG TPA: hypothetical protein VNR60_00980 [Croceibacterium sp.]|nr:hypothetical protein [Croceibacterium sp.]